MLKPYRLAIGVLIAAFPLAARAADGWYVSLTGGAYFRQPIRFNEVFFKIADRSITTIAANRYSYDTGAIVNFALGRRLGTHVRAELEGQYVNYTRGAEYPLSTDPRFPGLNGSRHSRVYGGVLERAGGTANLFYDFGSAASAFRPYLGLGGGAEYDHSTAGLYENSVQHTLNIGGGSSTQALVFGEAGFTVHLAARWSLVPAYRFEHGFATNGEDAHIAKLGIRYGF